MTDPVPGDDAITLFGDELLFLRFTAELEADSESPFGALPASPDPEVLHSAVQSLARRHLADPRNLRPHREALRRLLIVAQPDARVVLLRAGAGQGERLLDLYERAGAFVRYSKHGDSHRFGPPLELVDVHDEIAGMFVPRRSTGDFVRFRLGPAEHYAFSLLAAELVGRREGRGSGHGIGLRPPSHTDPAVFDPTMDGAIALPGRRVSRAELGGEPRRARIHTPEGAAASIEAPTSETWNEALQGLVRKNVVFRAHDQFELRPYLHDLAAGVMTQARHVLTRFDFGAEHWIVRDATFVPVRGSLFLLRATRDGGLEVRELDAAGLRDAVRRAIEELPGGDTVDEL